jgi:hypothetical protein
VLPLPLAPATMAVGPATEGVRGLEACRLGGSRDDISVEQMVFSSVMKEAAVARRRPRGGHCANCGDLASLTQMRPRL